MLRAARQMLKGGEHPADAVLDWTAQRGGGEMRSIPRRQNPPIGAAALLFAVVGCSGLISEPGETPGPGPSSALCRQDEGPSEPLGARIRRLNKLELRNTVADLIGDPAAALTSDLESDPRTMGFSTGDERGISAGYVDALKRVAEGISAEFRKSVAQPKFAATCFANDAGARTCADKFVRDFVRRAFRRPLEDAEVAGFLSVYDAGRDTGTDGNVTERFKAGLDYVVRTVMQSPHFVFRTELGGVSAQPGSTTPLTPFEVASAVSYGIIASPPDAALLDAAEAGELKSRDEIIAQARRLIMERPERFQPQVRGFVLEWLRIDYDKPDWNKDTTAYPKFSAAVKNAFAQETAMYLDDWLNSGASFSGLLTGTDGFVNNVNGPIYGAAAASATFEKMPLDATQRAGILTQPSFLGSYAHPDGTSPVLRGLAILSQFLCGTPPPVPAMVPPLPPVDKTEIKTTRQRFERHTSAAFCKGCHSAFDPMGFVFENYDAVGAFRTEQNGVPVDSTGAIVGSASSDQPIANAVELAKALAASPDVYECFTRQAFRFEVGRQEGPTDQCAVRQHAKAFTDSGLDLRELLISIVASPAFGNRIIPQKVGP
jgi:hypothetical protein